MRRRDFVLAALSATSLPRLAAATQLPRDIKITRIVGFDLASRRSKIAGKNSHLDVHGDRARDRMVRVFTTTNIEGLGTCWASKQVLAGLLGQDPFTAFDAEKRRFAGPLGSQTMPLWDLAGKLLGQPVYRVLGAAGPPRVPVYDGSIYFADLLPQYASRWQDRFKEEIDMGRARGHRAFKIKIGRGYKWMGRAAGDARDVEVVQLIRQHAGDRIVLGVDANDGYDLAGAIRFLDQVAGLDLGWVEEMFPERIDRCLELKKHMLARGWKTLLADGENFNKLDGLRPYIEAKAMDVLQADMNHFGIDGILTEADWARPQGLLVAPHNWGSLIGFHTQLHVGRSISNFYRAEQDPLSSDLLIADGYEVRDGACSLPDTPGFGLKLDEKKFRDVKIDFDLKV